VNQLSRAPSLEVEIGGASLERAALLTVAEARIQQRFSQPTLCELVFLGFLTAGPPATLGDEISIRLEQQTLFTGDITSIERIYGSANSQELRLRGYDRLQRLRKRQRARAYQDIRLDELAQDLVLEDGISVDCELQAPLLRHVVQSQRSDFDLLSQLSARFGVYFWLDGTTLRLTTLASAAIPVSLRMGDNLLRASFEQNADAPCSRVRAAAWDPSFGRLRTGEATRESTGRDVPCDVPPGSFHGEAMRVLMNQTAEDDSQAQLAAQGELDRRASRGLIFSGLADGNARLNPGARVEVLRAASDLCGTYTLTSVSHRIDAGAGYISEISTEPPPDSVGRSGAGLSIGIVTQVQDPESLGRIRVKLSGYDDAESGWLPIVLPGVGEGKGIIAVPNIGDTVLLMEPDADPSRAIVLGGLQTSGTPVDMGVREGQVRRFLIRTAAHHILSFDDETKTVRLEDSSRSYLEFSPEQVTLSAKTDIRLEAPGKKIKILADQIDFERG
jgi:phage protein D/phage baseplate assembly protein gpV